MKAVIFDIDDTLISEYDFVISGHRAVAGELAKDKDINMSEVKIHKKLMELADQQFAGVYDRFFEGQGIECSKERIESLIKIYTDHDPDIRPYDDVRDTLEGLRQKGIKTGIISDGDPARQRRKLKVCGLEGDFDCVIVTDELGDISYRKPDTRSFELMSKRLGVDLCDMLYVGDNPSKDFCIAGKIPVKTARIIRDKGIYAGRDYRDGIKETYRIDTLRDVLELV